MATSSEQLHALIDRLSSEEQARLLHYAQELAQERPLPRTPLPPGSPPDALLRFTATPEVAEALQQAADECEDECEQVAADEWP